MRPRVIPAEDATDGPISWSTTGRFNEAAGYPRGRRFRRLRCKALSHPCFNEAAGYPRGRRRAVRQLHAEPDLASMRPRVIPAEDFNGGLEAVADAKLQ